jgi:hypothetical protein
LTNTGFIAILRSSDVEYPTVGERRYHGRGTMEKVRRDLVCICAECSKIIKFLGNVENLGTALVSHGICPDCAQKLYGGILSPLSGASFR